MAGGYLRPYRWQYALSLFGIALVQLFLITITLTPKLFVDSVITAGNQKLLIDSIIALGIFFVFVVIMNLLGDYLLGKVDASLVTHLRVELFRKVQYLPFHYFSRTQPGEITALFAQELLGIRNALRTMLPNGFAAILQFLFALGAMFFLDWRLALITVIALPVLTYIPRLGLRLAGEADFLDKVDDARTAYAVQDNVQAHTLIRALGLEEDEVTRFRALLAEPTLDSRRARLSRDLGRPFFRNRLMDSLTNLQQVFILSVVAGVGAILAYQGAITVATFITVIPVFVQVSDAVNQIAAFFKGLIDATSSMERINQLTKHTQEPTLVDDTQKVEPFQQSIRFKDVLFRYKPEDSKLGLTANFEIPAKTNLAIVGRSGSGKTTLLKLLMRLYTPNEGQILIDDIDLNSIRRTSFYRQLGVVLQETTILNTSVRENIILSKPDATQDEITAAALAAGIHHDILAMPAGYDTKTGEGGKFLSPGQRQRIALARALLRTPPILLLDEPTAALDPAAEQAVMQTLKTLSRNHTIIMVSHRITSLQNVMDTIIMLEQGKVVEQGAIDELLEQDGPFARLWNLQSGFMVRADGRYAEVTPERLAAIPLFADLEEDRLKALAGQFVTERYKAGETVLREGQPGQRFFIIVRGKVAAVSKGYGEKPIVLEVLEDGDHFGEIALLEGGQVSTDIVTQLPTIFLTLSRAQFDLLMEHSVAIRQSLEDTALTRSLRKATRKGRTRSQFSLLDNLMDEDTQDNA